MHQTFKCKFRNFNYLHFQRGEILGLYYLKIFGFLFHNISLRSNCMVFQFNSENIQTLNRSEAFVVAFCGSFPHKNSKMVQKCIKIVRRWKILLISLFGPFFGNLGLNVLLLGCTFLKKKNKLLHETILCSGNFVKQLS